MPTYDKYHAKWKANMAKCSKYHAKYKVTMPKCSKYHPKWQVLVPNCCKYKANGTGKESKKKPKPEAKKTRCSPRIRMLTRLLMVQMSKHMDMQSRRTLVCNSLFEQSCAYFPCYQSAVWSGKCGVWSV